MKFKKYDVVMFNEYHKWFGCLGFVEEIKPNKIMVGIPIPERGIAYVYCQKEDIEYIGDYPLEAVDNDEE